VADQPKSHLFFIVTVTGVDGGGRREEIALEKLAGDPGVLAGEDCGGSEVS
jgi:hypothetical protein